MLSRTIASLALAAALAAGAALPHLMHHRPRRAFGLPQVGGDHQLAHGFGREMEAILLSQLLLRQGGAEVGIGRTQ